MDCNDLLRIINQYIDGEADPAICCNLEHHLTKCDPCKVVVDTLRRTVKLYKAEEIVEVPLETQRRLNETLRARWKQTMASPSSPLRNDPAV